MPAVVAEVDAAEDKRGDDTAGEGEAAIKPHKKAKKREASKDNATKKKHEAEGSDEDEESEILPVALELGVGGRALIRDVAWNQDVLNHFGPYALHPGPEGSLWLELFPASFFGGGLAAKLGLFGGFNYGFGVKSMTKSGSTLATTFQDFTVGAKMRFSLGALSPYASAAYSQQTFKLATGSTSVPNFDYKIARVGAGARLAFTPSAFAEVGAAFLLVTDVGSQTGEIGSKDFFPRAKAYGVDAGASVGLRVLGPLAARIGADFRQLGLDFHVRPGDTSPAVGGATDRYITIWAGIALVLDGQPRDSGDDEEEPTGGEAPAAETDGAETE
jgi:hypothetical protein